MAKHKLSLGSGGLLIAGRAGLKLSTLEGGGAGPSLLSATTLIAGFGDSQTYGDFRMKSYLEQLPLHLGVGYVPSTIGKGTGSVVGYNMGVSGQTGAQISARAATIMSSPATRLYGMFGQNDGAGISAADQIGYWTVLLDAAVGAGKTIVAIPQPDTTTVLANSTLQDRKAAVLAWLRGAATATYGAALDVLPDSIWDGFDFASATYAFDGVHPTNFGADRLAYGIAAVERPKFEAATNAELIAALGLTGNLYTANFAAGGGTVPAGATGTVASGLALSLTGTTGLTIIASLATIDGLDCQIIDVSGVAATGTIQWQLREAASVVFDISEPFKAFGRIKSVSTDGASAPAGVQAIGFEAGGGRHPWLSRFSPLNEGGGDYVIDGWFQNLPEENSGSGTSISIDLATRYAPGAVVNHRVILAAPSVFKMAP